MSQLVQAGASRTTSPRPAGGEGRPDDLAVVAGLGRSGTTPPRAARSCPWPRRPGRPTGPGRPTAARRGAKSAPLSLPPRMRTIGPVEAVQGLDGGVHGRGLGVVDELDAADAVRTGSSRCSRPRKARIDSRMRGGRDAQEPADQGRGQDVLQVVGAEEGDLARPASSAPPARRRGGRSQPSRRRRPGPTRAPAAEAVGPEAAAAAPGPRPGRRRG